MAKVSATRQVREEGWIAESGSLIAVLFGMALVVGLLAGLGAQRYMRDFGHPVAIYQGSAPKEIVKLGYTDVAAYNIDHAREHAVIDKLLAAPVGSQMLWENPETGNRGVIWVARQAMLPNGAVCRDLVRHTLLNNTYRNTAGTTCRPANGSYPPEIPWHAE